MSDRREPVLLSVILFPFRLILFLGNLVSLLWLLLICGGLLALFGAFFWFLLTGVPR